jgi:predicted membrane protein
MNSEEKFGVIVSIAYLFFLLFFFDFEVGRIPLIWYAPLVFLGLLTTFWPQLLAPIRTGWLYLGHLLGIINSTIILSVIYFVIITPISVLRKLFSTRKVLGNSTWIQASRSEKQNFYKQY